MKLLQRKVVKEDFIFCEEEPKIDYFFAYGEGNPYRNDYSQLKDEWQHRKDKFVPS